MNFWVCVDASLVLKLVLGEDDSPQAIVLWRRRVDENVTAVKETLPRIRHLGESKPPHG